MPSVPPERPSVPNRWTFPARLVILDSRREGAAMKVEVQIDPRLEEPVIVLRAPSPSPSTAGGRRCG